MNDLTDTAISQAARGLAVAHQRQQAAALAFGVASLRQGSAITAAGDDLQQAQIEEASRVAERIGRQAYVRPRMSPAASSSALPAAAALVDVFIAVRVDVQGGLVDIFVNVWDLIVVSIFNSDVAAAEAAEAAEAADAAAADVADVADVVDVVDVLIV